ncbi:UDP-N-acetylmuramoyl-L-alanyl-D-glutamate--2,6-diaminopimelate ligase [Paenibacillus timonensis]|uniref:UDP-N-acetylmuramyl-tripeptide synthetase n=1 Tax=Paenibacillus timonensis TaxID=225915 RepID=A0ABW3S885_9BACL|nr:UDP-N-acetylmuramoyl-L-alanyl-D-glutamate--2,6-diaminopimelate ligase [Paenibacillus timonensis]MCH1638477.1 UDP-N-acetylmuramoyl-L-alanyl-D-glutamate--2,6-diaminopimelate ligase [Paenibacillus timonensis]
MKLNLLLDPLLIKQVQGKAELEISGIEIDSRHVTPGCLFVCLPGALNDGHRYAAKAIEAGAIALMTEKELADIPSHITIIRVPDTRRALAILADVFYGRPSSRLKLIGITGTNGKTTTTHLVEHLLNQYGKRAGLIGTLYMRIGNYREQTVNTTPESLVLQRSFRKMLEHGAEYAVVEVSSHALDMGRVRGCQFRTAVLTNVTHDHLDYHESMDRYSDTKSLLFSQLGGAYGDEPKFAILNADDSVAAGYARKTAAQVITYGVEREADIRASQIRMKPDGTSLRVDTFRGPIDLDLKLLGLFNVYNVLAAIAVGLSEGIPLQSMKRSLESFEGVTGRFEPIYAGQDFTVILDYAHNPDGLENVLQTAKTLTQGKLVCVCGCEGDKDRMKRPIMARVATSYADLAIFTSDNTRSEDPDAILSDMLNGVEDGPIPSDAYVAIADRREAISLAIEQARPGDCVVVAGRGHETHLIVKDRRIPFDDREVIQEALAGRLGYPVPEMWATNTVAANAPEVTL